MHTIHRLGVYRNQFLKFRLEPDPANWKKVPAGSSGQNRNWFIKPYILICYFVCCQTGRHFKSSRRKLTNVRIKRLTTIKRHNEVLTVYSTFSLCSPNFFLLWTFVRHQNVCSEQCMKTTEFRFRPLVPAGTGTLRNGVPAMLFLLVPTGTLLGFRLEMGFRPEPSSVAPLP